MNWHLYAALAAVATSLTGAAAQAPPAATADTEVLDLDQERYQRMTVPVTIGDQGPFDFLIDTGAQATVLSDTLADRLGLHNRRPATLVGMASRLPAETVDIEDLTLGSRSFYIQTAPVVDAAHIGDADGILGLDSLQNQRVLLDFNKQQITVADAENTQSNRGFEIVVQARKRLGQLIITRAMLDGVPTTVIVDTGAQSSIGNPALLTRLRRMHEVGQTSLIDVNGQHLSGALMLAKELQVERVRLSNFAILFADSPSFHALGLTDEPALILGMAELKIFRRVAIDFKRRQVLFDLPRGVTPFDAMIGGRLGA